MGSRATVYSAFRVTLNVASQAIESGRGPSDFLSIVQQEDDFGYTQGLDGEGAFSENRSDYTVLEVTLMQTAAGNDVLMAIHFASKAAGGLLVPVFVEDRKGNSKMVSGEGIILKTPDETFAKEVGTTVWRIGVHAPERQVGGH